MAQVKFTDNSAQVKGALSEAVIAYLHEAGGELQAQAKRNSRVGTGQLKNSWDYRVDESKGVTTIGSPLENAIWEEFGKKILCRIKIGQYRKRLNFYEKVRFYLYYNLCY